jgi:hypothetical protein
MKLFSRLFPKPAAEPPTLKERVDLPGPALGAEQEGERAAQTRIAQRIDAGSIDFSAYCAGHANLPAMLCVAALCKDTTLLPRALASIHDPALVAQLAVQSPSSRVRQLAAEAVEDPAQLKQLLKQVRNKDKNVYKIIKQKCDALNAEERKAAQIANEAESLCASLERHGQRIYDPLYTPAFEHLEARWRSADPPPSAVMAQRGEGAIARCRAVIAEHGRQLAEQAARLAAQRAAREDHERAQNEAEEAVRAQSAAEAQRQTEAALLREAEQTALAAKQAADEQLFRRLAGLIRNANGALADGNTQRAAGLRRAIEDKLAGAPAPPLHLARLLQQLDGKLNELKQWKDYAVAPKRMALIEEMQALAGSTEQPKALADRIKSLQQEWRTISQGIVSDTGADWERFHLASQAAYQPCREYFAAQAALRQDNLDKRKVVLERLAAFEQAQSDESTDWRLLADVLREAPQEWHRFFPVDREAARAAQAEFDAAMARLHARLNAWHERNAEQKHSLIKRARHLLTLEDGREAIDAVKRLQSQWKETPAGSRDQDQRLWSEFRELCDAVYKKRQQAFADYTAGLEANKAKALALCEEAERLAALSGMALLEGAAKISDWRSAFDALDEMPRADARALQGRFERALDLCETRLAQQHERDEEQSYSNLFEAGRHIQSYAWAVAQNAGGTELQILKQAAETFIAGVQRWPKGGPQALSETLTRAGAMSGADIAASERALRTLCIRCEIHSETPTPAEDEGLRREYQVQRLMRGMGQGTQTNEGDWHSIAFEWIRSGAVAPAIYESLRERLMRCRAKSPAKKAGRDASGDPDNRAGRNRDQSARYV